MDSELDPLEEFLASLDPEVNSLWLSEAQELTKMSNPVQLSAQDNV